MSNTTIVVARYNENIEWTKSFENVVVYNKGTPLGEGYNEIFLNNVGREGHTFYTYIYENYHHLPNHIIFLQGNPFDHSPNIIETLNGYTKDPNLNIDFGFISEAILVSNVSRCPHHIGYIPLQEVYTRLFDEVKTEMPFVFGAGGQFMVSNTQVWKRPREFYEKVVKMLEYDPNPSEGFVIERFHPLIFSI